MGAHRHLPVNSSGGHGHRAARHSKPLAGPADRNRYRAASHAKPLAGLVRIFDACTACQSPRALLARARARVTRALTPAERRTFGVQS